MLVYRISNRKYAGDLSGNGAMLNAGRWNKQGTAVLYTSETQALALLEVVVHTPPMFVPDLDLLALDIPDDSITEFRIEDLPKNWKDFPAPTILSTLAQKWYVEQETITLKVPSCVIHSGHNLILNCNHPNFKDVKLVSQEEFHFDARLIQ